MEKILIGIDADNIDLRPCIHGINLAERMKRAAVFFLLISDTSKHISDTSKSKLNKPNKINPDKQGRKVLSLPVKTKKDLESLIEDGRSRGVIIGYYTAKGDFRNEVINFIKSRRIDLLVIGAPPKKIKRNKEDNFTECIKKIQHRVDCRIEVVRGKY